MEHITEGYIARDKNGQIMLYEEKPTRRKRLVNDKEVNVFVPEGELNYYELDENAFPNIKWEDEPKKAKVIIQIEE